MNFQGIILGAISFIIIGVWHPIVVKGEYYIGKNKCAIVFSIIGVTCCIASFLMHNDILSTAFALFGFSGFWGIKEVYEQAVCVEKGWFPKRKVKRAVR